MSNRQKPDSKTKNNHKEKRGAGSVLLALLLIIAALAAVYAFFQPPDPAGRPAGAIPQVSMIDGKADYNLRCDAVHETVDKAVTAQNLTVADVQRDAKEAARQADAGKIVWNARSILIEGAGEGAAAKLKRALEESVKSAGGKVLAMEADRYHGFAVTRIDVGFEDQLGGGPLTIVSDRLYVAESARRVDAVARPKPRGEHKGEIALIIDDFGYRQDMIGEFAALRTSFTFAVIPFKPHSKEAAAKGLASGHQVMLHLPMEPVSGVDAAELPITVHQGMNETQIRDLIDRAAASLPGLVGVNNHQGSKSTADRKMMEMVMRILRDKSLFFVDSRTSGQSVAADTARREKVKTTENDMFLDGIADTAYVKKQLRAAGDMAIKMGSVTVIGHARPSTAAALREVIPELEARGIKFVFVSQLVR